MQLVFLFFFLFFQFKTTSRLIYGRRPRSSKKEVPPCSFVKSYFICNVAAPHIFFFFRQSLFWLAFKNSSRPVAIMAALVIFDYIFLPAQCVTLTNSEKSIRNNEMSPDGWRLSFSWPTRCFTGWHIWYSGYVTDWTIQSSDPFRDKTVSCSPERPEQHPKLAHPPFPGRGVKLTAHCDLVPRLRMSGAFPQVPNAYLAYTGKNLPLTFTKELTSSGNKTASCNGDSPRGCQEWDTAYCRPLIHRCWNYLWLLEIK